MTIRNRDYSHNNLEVWLDLSSAWVLTDASWVLESALAWALQEVFRVIIVETFDCWIRNCATIWSINLTKVSSYCSKRLACSFVCTWLDCYSWLTISSVLESIGHVVIWGNIGPTKCCSISLREERKTSLFWCYEFSWRLIPAESIRFAVIVCQTSISCFSVGFTVGLERPHISLIAKKTDIAIGMIRATQTWVKSFTESVCARLWITLTVTWTFTTIIQHLFVGVSSLTVAFQSPLVYLRLICF